MLLGGKRNGVFFRTSCILLHVHLCPLLYFSVFLMHALYYVSLIVSYLSHPPSAHYLGELACKCRAQLQGGVRVQPSRSLCAQFADCVHPISPVCSVEKYTDYRKVIDKINDTPFGLQAGVFTQDIHKAFYAFKHVHAVRSLSKFLSSPLYCLHFVPIR